MAKTLSQMLRCANASVASLTAEEAKRLAGKPDVIFIDVRETSELRRTGKIPDAIHVTRGMLEFHTDSEAGYHKSEIDRAKMIVVVCAAGQRSLLAARTLNEMGFDNVWNLAGGMKAWKAAGGATEHYTVSRLKELVRISRMRAPGLPIVGKREGCRPGQRARRFFEPGPVPDRSSERTINRRSTRARYERIARYYDLLDLYFEYGRYRPLRAQLFAGLSGRILDAGVGTGRNMPFYPKGTELVGIDFSPTMLSRAGRRRDRLGLKVDLFERDVLETGFPDQHFDNIVATFLFCVLDKAQQIPALQELRRICKPTGLIHVLEYSWAQRPLQRTIMRLWAPWVRWAYGAEFDRNTEQYADTAALEVVENRFVYRDIIRLITARPASPPGQPRGY